MKEEHYIDSFCSELKLSSDVRGYSKEILLACKEKNITCGKRGKSVASAIIYISALIHGEKITQGKIRAISGVSCATIRNRYGEILEVLEHTKANKKGDI